MPRRWTKEELDIATSMLTDGATFGDIAKKIDRSAAAIEAKLKEKKTSNGNSSKPTPESKLQTSDKSTSTERTTSEASRAISQADEVVTAAPQSIPATNDADEEASSTMKYIIGAVVVAVVLWLVIE